MNARGFALLAVLWVITALGVLAGSALLTSRQGQLASRNRLVLARAEWAREACVEIVLGRYAADSTLRSVDTTDLGRGTWCTARLTDPASRLNLNTADSSALRALLGNDSLVDALIDWRDADTITRAAGAEADWYRDSRRPLPRNGSLRSVRELSLVRGFEAIPFERLQKVLTTDGVGRIDLNLAAPEVLATIPGLGAEAIGVLLGRRRAGERVSSADGLLGGLSPVGRRALADRFPEFMSRAAFTPGHFILEADGGVRGYPLLASAQLEVTPAGRRLAVLTREVQ